MNDIQSEIDARASKAPRVTPADIETAIGAEYTFLACDGVFGAAGEDRIRREGLPMHQSLALLTICVLVLRNGFTVVGTSACASPENFDADIGRKVARADAVRQVWPLLGYALKDRLTAEDRGLAEGFAGVAA